MARSNVKSNAARRLWGWLSMLGWTSLLCGAESGSTVVVIYNRALPESKEVADYYADRRAVPSNQVFGFDLPKSEAMSRKEFEEQLQQPLLRTLLERKLFVSPDKEESPPLPELANWNIRVASTTVRYAALCYGVPTKIQPDPGLKEPGVENLRPELRRNEASVDSELSVLPLRGVPLTGVLTNRLYGVTNSHWLHPGNGLLLVTRLDGPSAAIARGLVDKAIEAETNGLWGRAYFDARGLGEGPYRLGDSWIQGAARVAKAMGFETDVDEKPETFRAGYPLSQVAFYAGWYDGSVSGPFARPAVEFMPGAFVYHLHSFSAETLRSSNANWVGPLLARGATATMGCVYEPYLSGTPDVQTFFDRFIYRGFSFGEAAYVAQAALSWQNIALGDPLYRPFATHPARLEAALVARKSKLVEWSHLRAININLAMGGSTAEALSFLNTLPELGKSAVLTEKIAEIYLQNKQLSDAIDTLDRVLRLDPSPQQKLRVLLKLGQLLNYYGRSRQAFAIYGQLLRDYPDYPDLLSVYRNLQPLAEQLGEKEMQERCTREIRRLSAAETPGH